MCKLWLFIKEDQIYILLIISGYIIDEPVMF